MRGNGAGVEGDVVDSSGLGGKVGGNEVVDVDGVGGGVAMARKVEMLGSDGAGEMCIRDRA